METVSFIKFKTYIEKKKPTVIIYNDENNSDYMQGTERRCYSIAQPLHMCLTFNDILIATNPNIVQLQSKSGKMRFNYIHRVSVDTSGSLLGDVVTLYCNADEKTKAYTLVIR